MYLVEEILAVPKRLVGQPREKKKTSPTLLQWDLDIEAEIEGLKVYVRRDTDLAEDFSIGLRYEQPGIRPIVVLRFNGDHGGHRNPDGTRIDEGPHVHAPTLEEFRLAVDEAEFQPHGRRYAMASPRRLAHFPAAWDAFCRAAAIAEDAEVAAYFQRRNNQLQQTSFMDLDR
jgi:hypothetical protein